METDDGVFIEDVAGRSRAESISTVSSDPLDFRHNGGPRSSCTSACGSDSDGEDVKSVCSTAGEGRGNERTRRFHAVEVADVETVAALRPQLQTLATSPLPVDAEVSEAPIATVSGIILSSAIVVAERRESALIMDVGTVMCLADGTVVGAISTLLGPIASCSYAILCDPGVLASLALDSKVDEGTLLHYQLSAQSVLYDPVAQCDGAKGTDASFMQDEELPPTARPDFSDDDEERHWKKRVREVKAHHAAGQLAVADISTDDEGSEVEFDDEGNILSYRPRQRTTRREGGR